MVYGLGFRVVRFRVQGLGFRGMGLGFRIQGLGLGFRVSGGFLFRETVLELEGVWVLGYRAPVCRA